MSIVYKKNNNVTIDLKEMNYKDKNIAILGAGVEGLDAEKFLKERGAKVSVLDQKTDINYLKNLDKYDIIVRSPGVYPLKKEIVDAKKHGVRITTPTHIFFDEFDGQIIGVTGTKGKGTTSSLIYNILKEAKFDVYLGGNIGTPVLSLLPKLNSSSFVVMEMSSFQLMDLPVSPDIAVVLNITEDHMDWHKDKKEYLEAKMNIVKFQSVSNWAVINKDYKTSKSFAQNTKANVIYFNKKTLTEENKKGLKLRGEHNLENIAAAVAVAKILNIKKEIIKKVIHGFKGLEHRLEFVSEVRGVKFYNDSFATGPQPTIAAIKSFDEDITLILGGSEKGLKYGDLRDEIEKQKNVKNIITIGEIGDSIIKGIKNKNIIRLGKTSMIRIIESAVKITKPGGVVILSPAAASFDMFKNYKDRGQQFKKAVLSLK